MQTDSLISCFTHTHTKSYTQTQILLLHPTTTTRTRTTLRFVPLFFVSSAHFAITNRKNKSKQSRRRISLHFIFIYYFLLLLAFPLLRLIKHWTRGWKFEKRGKESQQETIFLSFSFSSRPYVTRHHQLAFATRICWTTTGWTLYKTRW